MNHRHSPGCLLRTSFYSKWKKTHSESRKADTWYPGEMRFYAWLESKSR